MMGLTQLL
ncbi:unnamed protein product [Linum tenue]|uniref:Uncharacterized protein n=1 Tax=Linum tenue TaxID=586396 RepID=A0AAV0R645_9ROSI|nr:unnamed protein product [Linum tenue]